MKAISDDLTECRLCPRLVKWRETVAQEKRKSFQSDRYWGKPVPNFGDPSALRLIVGLAPAAHGANRTGRMFTGDRSGDWLFRALYRAEIANQADSTAVNDGLTLSGVLITAAVHCAPPDNKPTGDEMVTCRRYLTALLASRSWKSVLCLGGIAWQQTHLALGEPVRTKFTHGAESQLDSGAKILASYHPSQQNTFTGRLTEVMLDEVIQRFISAGD